jgi:hypothetical protein
MLISHKYKIPGYLLIFIGLVLTILYFSVDFRFEMPVFAVFSSYFETKFFTAFRTNFADELIILLFLAGLTLVAFSKEKNESELLQPLRIKALIKTAIINSLVMTFSVVFIYGSGFMAILIVNIFLPFILYLSIFNLLKFRGGANSQKTGAV